MIISKLNNFVFHIFIVLNIGDLSLSQYYNSYGFTNLPCSIPQTLQGEWFSRENGQNTFTTIDESSFSNLGRCSQIYSRNDNYTMLLKDERGNCHYCVRLFIRSLNVLEKIQSLLYSYCDIKTNVTNFYLAGCERFEGHTVPSIESVCRTLDPNQELITMFSTNPSGKNCRSSLEGVWKMAYQNRYKFTGECSHPEANITACQAAGTQFFNLNQQFTINYRKCENMEDTYDAEVQYKCLGDWYIGKNHYFAVVNSRETRVEEKYRCFLANRDDDTYISVSITAECNTLRSPQEGPERLQLIPVKADIVAPKCTLPENFTGTWVNTANFDAEVIINSTHMVEKWNPDSTRIKQEIYICQERRDSRYVLARLGINGCQKDFVCFDFVPRHHNIIRYRKGQAMITDSFATVCAWAMFEGKEEWMYDIMIAKTPVATKCPVAGKYKFQQSGEALFETRIRGGVTQAPIPNVYCKERISDLSVCDKEQKVIAIDADYCVSVDHKGQPLDIYTEPDYTMQCIGFWKENLKSYLITYDPLDAYSSYRCWTYQKVGLNEILMSMSVGAFCHIKQTIYSNDSREGAQVALKLVENEREHDDCAMYFDDGKNPYSPRVGSVQVLRPNKASSVSYSNTLLIAAFLTIAFSFL